MNDNADNREMHISIIAEISASGKVPKNARDSIEVTCVSNLRCYPYARNAYHKIYFFMLTALQEAH